MVILKYLGRTPKRIELPIPFLARSDKTGEVICNPTGEFTDADAESLMSLAPDMWERVTPETTETDAPSPPAPTAKKPSGLEQWRAKQRLIKQQKSEPSQPQAEGSHTPSP